MRLPADGAVTGWAACLLHGAALIDGLLPDGATPMPVPLAVGPRARLRPDGRAVLHRDRLDPAERTVRRGIACVTGERATFDAMRTARDLREAVVVLDMMAAAERTTIRRIRAYADTRAGWSGVGQVRAAMALADESSRSPNETRMRLIWVLDAGLPRPRCNQPVHDGRGRLVGVADLFDADSSVAGEFDGADHRTTRRHTRDVGKQEAFRELGIEVFRVTGTDLHDVALVVRRMRGAHARGQQADRSGRRWLLEGPAAEPVMTLDELLDHRDWLASLRQG